MAVKIVDIGRIRATPKGEKQVQKETEIMRSIQHPHVLRLHELLTCSERVYLVMDIAQVPSAHINSPVVTTHGRGVTYSRLS